MNDPRPAGPPRTRPTSGPSGPPAGAGVPRSAPRGGRGAATRERVFAAAVELFAEQGFTGTTVEEIAAAAGVAKGTVFYNFRTKEQLFEELLRHGVDALIGHFETAIAGLHGQAALDALVRAELEQAAANPAFARLYLGELYRTGRPWWPAVTRLRTLVAALLTDVIIDAQARGEMDPAIDAPMAGGTLLGVIAVVALDWLVYTPERTVDEVRDSIVRMVRGRLAPT